MTDEDGRLKDEVVEELRKRRNDDSELVPHEEVEKQVRDDNCEKSVKPAAYLIGEPGYAELFFNEEHFVREKILYESLDEAREAAAKHEDFEFKPLYSAEQMIEDVEKDIEEFEDAIEDAEPGQDMLELKAGLRALLDRKRRLEEVTQNGEQ